MKRRNFLKIGVSLPILSQFTRLSPANDNILEKQEKSVVWLWLGGGPSHIELWNPVPNAPVEYRSVFGAIPTNVADIEIGGELKQLAGRADRLNIVHSFNHGDANHNTGTHWVMTGHKNPNTSEGSVAQYPSYGAIASEVYGSYTQDGVPTYVRSQRIEADGPIWLGEHNAPFDANGEGKENLKLRIEQERFRDRQRLLTELNKNPALRNRIDFNGKAGDIVLGKAYEAFQIEKEEPRLRERYGNSPGQDLLLARRLVERGCRFVSIHYGGWDNHVGIYQAMKPLLQSIDAGISAFIDDISDRGMNKDVLLVITGEFGRTPKINPTSGRDHWPGLSSLCFSGGDFPTGRIIGKSSPKAEGPDGQAYYPIDVERTIFDHFGISKETQRMDSAGRPRYLLEGESRNILV